MIKRERDSPARTIPSAQLLVPLLGRRRIALLEQHLSQRVETICVHGVHALHTKAPTGLL